MCINCFIVALVVKYCTFTCIQWNPVNTDAKGTCQGVLIISGVHIKRVNFRLNSSTIDELGEGAWKEGGATSSMRQARRVSMTTL